MAVRVATAGESVICERATIERGTTSAELMRRAGERAAALIAHRHGNSARNGVAVFAGPGNNGGDGWVVAGALGRTGFPTRVIEVAAPKTPESIAARSRALESAAISVDKELQGARVVVDALLGTGASGPVRGPIGDAVRAIRSCREADSTVVALDVPSGLDATTGAHDDAVIADLTISFGTVKRGQLLARDICGSIAAVDIGLDEGEAMACLPLLVDHAWVHSRVPSIPQSAHKGTRKTLTIVGGGRGMAGAAILAGEGALRAGIGLLRILVASENTIAIHAGIPAAVVGEWPDHAAALETLVESSHAVAIGPGLGATGVTRDLVERILLAWSGPVVIDADAINVFAGDMLSLSQLLRGRPAVVTPHPAELARLIAVETRDVVAQRFDIGLDVAAQLGAAVLLKGSPTVVFAPSGARYVIAAGTAALATGGSGDVLTGMIGTLIAQAQDHTAAESAACAAFVHGRAAELCRSVRGVTLDDVLHAMPAAWSEAPRDHEANVLLELESHS
jgi:NAD(P)H-hydrate epimerase